MEARILRLSLVLVSLFISTGASVQTRNFVVSAPTQEVAEQVGRAAEEYRRDLAVFWLGEPLPPWSKPCRISVRPGALGAGGQTTFQFIGGEVLNWNMYVQGSVERILDSVLPHEINHTIFACHFRRPLPRWADEGAATLFEHRSEQLKQLGLLNQVIKSDREFISLPDLLTMKEYPKGYRPMLILYAEGYALADFLVQQGGRQKYLKFLADGERMGWSEAIRTNYHHGGVEALQKNWQGWVMAGMPKLTLPRDQMLADADRNRSGSPSRPDIFANVSFEPLVRSQSPDSETDQRGSAEQTAAFSSPPDKPADEQAMSDVFNALPDSMRSPPQIAASRRARFEAPKPRPAVVQDVAQNSNIPAFESASSGRLNSRQRRHAAERSTEQKGIRIEDTFFEETADSELHDQSASTGPSSGGQRMHLPQERNAKSGSTPQWAGFPGQKELF